MNDLKETFWEKKMVILHSRDIRKCEKEFQILFDLNIKRNFYSKMNKVISNSKYKIIASAIKKINLLENMVNYLKTFMNWLCLL